MIQTNTPPAEAGQQAAQAGTKGLIIDRPFFFEEMVNQKLFKNLNDKQVDSIDTILNRWESDGTKDPRHLAYLMGTIYHECYDPRHPETRMLPITEFGGEKYLKSKNYWPHIGMGYVMLTWPDNYDYAGKKIGVDLKAHPEKALVPEIAAEIAVRGSLEGWFTRGKHSFPKYLNETKEDWINIRRTINVLDKAGEIAKYAKTFLKCIRPA